MAGARLSTGVSEPAGRVPGAPSGATRLPTKDFHAPLAFWFFWARQKNNNIYKIYDAGLREFSYFRVLLGIPHIQNP